LPVSRTQPSVVRSRPGRTTSDSSFSPPLSLADGTARTSGTAPEVDIRRAIREPRPMTNQPRQHGGRVDRLGAGGVGRRRLPVQITGGQLPGVAMDRPNRARCACPPMMSPTSTPGHVRPSPPGLRVNATHDALRAGGRPNAAAAVGRGWPARRRGQRSPSASRGSCVSVSKASTGSCLSGPLVRWVDENAVACGSRWTSSDRRSSERRG
ncbi:MAG: hypothetical protein JWR81_208, partial [Pseudonocardia sp.]|nr:hypothetical protein [Pseudonocardia sp.]